RPHPLDRLDADHPGRPSLHLPAARGGRRLSLRSGRLSPSRLLVPALLALGVLLAACGSSAPAAPPANQGLVLDRPTPHQLTLVDQHGHRVSLAALHG